MRRLAKWLGIVVGILVLLVVGAALILPMVISIDTVKGEIIAQVKSATGRDLTIDGPLSLSILPSPAISASKVALSNPPGAGAKPMVTLGKLEVQVQLIPLLSKTVVVERFVLVDPVIDLEIDKQGRANWNLSPAGGTGAAPQQRAAAGGGSGAADALASIRLGDVRLENGTVNYSDQRSNDHKTIDKINMTISLPGLDSPLKMNGSARFNAIVLNLKLDVAKAGDLIGAAGSAATVSLSSELLTFDFKGKASAATTTGTIDLKVPSLRKLAAWAGTPLAGEALKVGDLAIAGNLAMAGAEIKFTGAQLSFDAIKGKGDVTVNTAGARPSVKGELDLASLDINPYLAPEGQGGGGAKGGGGGSSGWSDEHIDTSGLKTADVDFKIAANGIKYRKIHVEKSAMTVRVTNGRMDVELTDFAAYQGGGKASIVVDGGVAPMAVTLNATFTGVQMEPLLNDAMSVDKLTGKGNITLALTSKGQSQRALVAALNGKSSLNVADGQIKGMDLLKMLNSATSAVGSALTGGGGETKFSHLTGTFTVTNGIVHNNDLVLDSPGLKAEGAGTIDLPQRRVDYKVTPKVAGLSVPVKVEGPWDNPSYIPDVAGIVKGGVGGAVDTLKGAVPGVGSGGKSGGGLNLPNPFK